MKRYLITTFIVFGLLSHSCSSDSMDNTRQDVSNQIPLHRGNTTISEELKPYIDRFVNEMNLRGHRVSTSLLSAELVQHFSIPHEDQPCGIGWDNYDNTNSPRIEIRSSRSCWTRWSETEKENLVFHELGHALLSLGHNNNTMLNGSKRSLMCGKTCNNFRVYSSLQNEQRSYYLDQLLHNEIAVPDWASEKIFSKTLKVDSFDNDIEGWTTKIDMHADFTEDTDNEIHYNLYIDDESPFSAPFALAIKSISNSSTTTFAFWQKTYELSNFANCSNILIRADITTEDLTKGAVGFGMTLLKKNPENDGEFESFAKYSSSAEEIGLGIINHENFEAQITCLPKETVAIRILLYLYDGRENPVDSTTATFDNLEIELYE